MPIQIPFPAFQTRHLGPLRTLFKKQEEEDVDEKDSSGSPTNSNAGSAFRLLRDPPIAIVVGSVWVSTTAMAMLEPCLPIWLMQTMHPHVRLFKHLNLYMLLFGFVLRTRKNPLLFFSTDVATRYSVHS